MKIEGNAGVAPLNPLLEQNYGENAQTSSGGNKNVVADTQSQSVNNSQFPGEKKLIEIIEKSNQDLKWYDTSLKFSIHEKTKQITVKIIDNRTKETLREIPPEKILDMVAAMLERTGLFVDKRA
jgi:flagellar protein FlaG